jgi:cytochrome c553
MIRTQHLAAALFALLATAAAAPAQDLERGRELFQLCTQCHGAQGEGMRLSLAPEIGGLPEWYVENQLKGFRAGYRGKHFDDIAGMRMRPMSLTLRDDADVKDVAAYVSRLPVHDPEPELVGGDAARGQTLYAPCTACHGPDGGGNQALNAPPLNHASDWYLLTQLSNFKAGIRGTAPGDVNGGLMRPMSMILPDEQALKDVIAYIAQLPATQPTSQAKQD